MAIQRLFKGRGSRAVQSSLLAIFLLFFICCRTLVAAPSIFDDDWKPATRQPQPASVKPTPTVPEIKPADPRPAIPNPPVVAPAGNPAPVRAAIPDSQQLAKTRKLFRELFQKELANREVQARRTLAQKLLDEGIKCPDRSADKYVLFAAARQAALEGRDIELCFTAIDALAKAFEVDGVAIKAQAAESGLRGDSVAATWDNCRAAMHVVNELLADENYAGAIKLSLLLQQSAAGDPFLKLIIPKRTKWIEAIRNAQDKLVPDLEKLKRDPNDVQAAQAVGAFNCFLRGDWNQGLPLLAKGSDASMKDLANAELARPADADAFKKLAEGWSAIAIRQPDAYRTQIRMHALTLFSSAMEGSTGLKLKALETAAAKLRQLVDPVWVDLVPKADPHEDRVHGTWSSAGFELTVDKGSGETRLELPYQPPEEYAFRIDFTVVAGEGTVYLGLEKQKKSFQFITGNWGNKNAGFQPIDGMATDKNRSAFKQRNEIGRRCSVIVEVRNDHLKAFIDGQLVRDWPTDYREFTPIHEVFVPRDATRLAIGTSATGVIFHRIEVLEYSGSGKWLRSSDMIRP